MNRKQRKEKRLNARLKSVPQPCPECGIREKHWISDPNSFVPLYRRGFWTCPKFYGPDGRRIAP